jgi:hypothetical protein
VGTTKTFAARTRLEQNSGAGGESRTLTGLLSPADFLTVYGFRRPELRSYEDSASGLRSGLSLHRPSVI